MDEYAVNSIKNHMKGFGRLIMVHFLGVALGWAAFPLILILLARYTTVDVPMAVFSVFATIIMGLMLLAQGNEYGITDRKPYKWARYKAKGFVLGASVGLVVFILELIIIAVADSNFVVSHPQFNISNVNSYIRMILYVPFFWFFKLTGEAGAIMPRVTMLSALIVIPIESIFTGIGYILGSKGIVLDFKINLFRRKK